MEKKNEVSTYERHGAKEKDNKPTKKHERVSNQTKIQRRNIIYDKSEKSINSINRDEKSINSI